MSTQPLCWVNAPLLITVIRSRTQPYHINTPSSPNYNFPDGNNPETVNIFQYNPAPFQMDEFVAFARSLAHGSSKDDVLKVFATSIETFPWTDY